MKCFIQKNVPEDSKLKMILFSRYKTFTKIVVWQMYSGTNMIPIETYDSCADSPEHSNCNRNKPGKRTFNPKRWVQKIFSCLGFYNDVKARRLKTRNRDLLKLMNSIKAN